jgi:hypothetical protein
MAILQFINPASKGVGVIANAGDCMDAGGRATQEQLPDAFYAAFAARFKYIRKMYLNAWTITRPPIRRPLGVLQLTA